MISVFICDDNLEYLKAIKECVENLILIDDLKLKLEIATTNPSEIIGFIENTKTEGLYFLDIELQDGYNGVEVAKEIRKHDPTGTIAFVTSHSSYRELTFKYHIEAVDYIQKGNGMHERIKACMERAEHKYDVRHASQRYSFKLSKGEDVHCLYDDILFFETDPTVAHRVVLHTKKMQYAYYHSLDKIDLPKNIFFRCHRSCIVNLNNLTESCKFELMQGKNIITMSNGAECKVALSKRSALLKFMEVSC